MSTGRRLQKKLVGAIITASAPLTRKLSTRRYNDSALRTHAEFLWCLTNLISHIFGLAQVPPGEETDPRVIHRRIRVQRWRMMTPRSP